MTRFDELFDLQTIDSHKRRLLEFWKGERKTVYSCFASSHAYHYNLRDLTDEQIIEGATAHLEAQASMPGFNIPAFQANYKPISIASYWGGRIIKGTGNHIALEPIINRAADIRGIRQPVLEGGDVDRAAGIWRKLSDALSTDGLGCTDLDMQGPLSTLSMLWKQDDLILSMYEAPEKVHSMLEMVTDFILQIFDAMEDRIGKERMSGPFWPRIWLPREIGVELVEDFMPLLSPDLYKEFGLPYLKKISNKKGGIFFHCCGVFSQHYENLAKSKVNFIGLEYQYPFAKPDELYDHFGSSMAFCPILSYRGWNDFSGRLDFFRYLTGSQFKGMRQWFTLDEGDKDMWQQLFKTI
ncbi:MAG TPA: hypothetical protein DD727_02875 [Clostridiales bacterium]|nr:hypothetical protein [Clostridiales bacterium]